MPAANTLCAAHGSNATGCAQAQFPKCLDVGSRMSAMAWQREHCFFWVPALEHWLKRFAVEALSSISVPVRHDSMFAFSLLACRRFHTRQGPPSACTSVGCGWPALRLAACWLLGCLAFFLRSFFLLRGLIPFWCKTFMASVASAFMGKS